MFREFLNWQANTVGNSEAIELLEIIAEGEKVILRREKNSACAKGNHPWTTDGFCSNCEMEREQYLRDLLSQEVAANAERARARNAQRYEQKELFPEAPNADQWFKTTGKDEWWKSVATTVSLVNTPPAVMRNLPDDFPAFNPNRGWD